MRMIDNLKRLAKGAPFTWERSRKLHWASAIALALLAYPVLVTLALSTGFVEWALKSDKLRVEIQGPAYSIWPGKVHAKHVRILANGTTQFILDGQDLVLSLRLFDLLRRRVHITKMTAQDVHYQMRVQVRDTKDIERRLKAYPPLTDLPGPHVIIRDPAKQAKKARWTVKIEGLDVAVRELWLFEYRYLGKGHLRGGFTVGPNTIQVETVVQELGPGDLRFGENETIATGLRGEISAAIPLLNPKEHADASFMEFVTGRINLRTDVESMTSVGSYFEAEQLEITKGKGHLTVDFYLDHGKLGSKSHLSYQTDWIALKGIGFGVGSEWRLDFDAAGSPDQLPVVRSSSKSSYVSLARAMRTFTVQIHDHHEEAELDTIQLSKWTDLKHAWLRMPQIVAVDLRDLPAVLDDKPPLEMKGELHASMNLDMDHEYWTHGLLHAASKDLRVAADGIAVNGSVKLDSALSFNPELKINRLEKLVLRLRDVSMRAGSRDVSGWWMDLETPRFTVWDKTPLTFDGTVGVQARDFEPVLKALAEKDVISDLIPLFTSMNNFRAAAHVRGAGAVTDVTVSSVSNVWDAAGRFFTNGKKTRLALLVGGQTVSLGIASKGDGVELKPFAKTDWLNARLREFPGPVLQVKPDKP